MAPCATWADLPCPVVFDHLARAPEPDGVNHPVFAMVVDLLQKGRAYVKLSGFYLDTKVGPRTRIEVVTDGLFLRRLQDDPALEGVGCVIFDELHERGLETDLAFALVRESQQGLREDLRIIAMSATLDPGPVAERP